MLFRILALLLALPCAALAQPVVRTPFVEAELVAATAGAAPGGRVQAALRLKMIPDWHVYWRNPGDAGQPPSLDWALPAGFEAGTFRWPAPRRIPVGPLMNYGYEDEVFLPFEVAVPAGASGRVRLGAHAKWLVCNEERCVPEDGALALEVAVGDTTPTRWAGALERTRAALPVPAAALGEWRLEATGARGHVALAVQPPAGLDAGPLAFLPFEEGKVQHAARQPWQRGNAGYVLEIPASEQPVGEFTRVSGLLVAERALRDGGPSAVEIDVPVRGAVTRVATSPARHGATPAPGAIAASLWMALALAFAGGVILNLMPCVLPVLSIKILGFAGGADAASLRRHGLIYAAGVVASFLALAGVLVALQAAGRQVGWGFQLQSPVVVGALAALFLALALNLSGAFEFPSLVPARWAGARARHAGADAFLSGVLAVAVASPCTAPFMGAAIGYAVTESAAAAFVVFAALGLGMALPYVALAWNPRWLRYLPGPGTWMTRLKRLLALPLYATVLWLAWVLALQLGDEKPSALADAWQPWSGARVERLLAEGRPVFVDFTAAWCVTCQVNKKLVLEKPGVEEEFRRRGVALLRADWTKRDPEIARALAALGRNGIPVYALYRPGEAPRLLPEVLTRELVLDALAPIPVRNDPRPKEPST